MTAAELERDRDEWRRIADQRADEIAALGAQYDYLLDAVRAAEPLIDCVSGCEARRDGGRCTCGGEDVHAQLLEALAFCGETVSEVQP